VVLAATWSVPASAIGAHTGCVLSSSRVCPRRARRPRNGPSPAPDSCPLMLRREPAMRDAAHPKRDSDFPEPDIDGRRLKPDSSWSIFDAAAQRRLATHSTASKYLQGRIDLLECLLLRATTAIPVVEITTQCKSQRATHRAGHARHRQGTSPSPLYRHCWGCRRGRGRRGVIVMRGRRCRGRVLFMRGRRCRRGGGWLS
jgi:hypothetical protein